MTKTEHKSPDSPIWQAALKAGEHEVLKFDPLAVRQALRESRERRGRAVPHRIKSILP